MKGNGEAGKSVTSSYGSREYQLSYDPVKSPVDRSSTTRGFDMRKAAVTLGTVGIGAGILYAFRRTREKGSSRSLAKDAGFDMTDETGFENQTSNLAPGIGATSEPELPSMSALKGGGSEGAAQQYEVDDRGTNQNEAVEILTKIKDEAFDSSDEKLSLALGRPVDEIQAWTKGEHPIDSDVLMKARALALERGLRLDEHD